MPFGNFQNRASLNIEPYLYILVLLIALTQFVKPFQNMI